MKVYTKTGDSGTTSLVGGKRVLKSHPRVEAYGDVDELISFIGIVMCDTPGDYEKSALRTIQERLMFIAAHFASDDSPKKIKEISEDDILFLEKEIDNMTDKLPEQKAFILPGAPKVASECHVARTICRRSERHALVIVANETLDDDAAKKIEICIKYLNRLSDYLFVLARYLCKELNTEEVYWLP